MNDQKEMASIENGTLALIARSEIDQQVSTAKKYPRSLNKFRQESLQMTTLNEVIAKSCIYALPRKEKNGQSKTIEGPSVRFAEIILSAWGNCRAGARIIGETKEFIIAQGVFRDLERNTEITTEVQRRITGTNGNRYSVDMVAMTSNAACSIALRNAIVKGVPKAFWNEIYLATRRTVAGDVKTLSNRRADAVKEFAIFGVTEQKILATLGKSGMQDIGIDDLVTLHGFLTAIQDGDTTPEEIFAEVVGEMKKPQAKEAVELNVGGTPAFTEQQLGQVLKEVSDGIKIVSIPVVTGDDIQFATVKKTSSVGPTEAGMNANQNGEIKCLSPGQVKMITAKIKNAGLSEVAIAERYGVATIDKIPADKANIILEMIKQNG
jgi:hypothetical protein